MLACMSSRPVQAAPEQGETLRRMEGAGNYNAWLMERSRPHLGRRVLDAGAGIGTFTEQAAKGRELVALEPDPVFVSALRQRFAERPNVTVVAGEAESLLPASAERFDSCICFNVLEHVVADGEAVAHFHELLRPGGHLLLLVPAHPFLFGGIDRTVAHERRYEKRGLAQLLGGAGFEIQVLRHVNPVGALGWLVAGRMLGREQVPGGPLRIFDRLVPVLRVIDRLALPVGLSLWAVARRPERAVRA